MFGSIKIQSADISAIKVVCICFISVEHLITEYSIGI